MAKNRLEIRVSDIPETLFKEIEKAAKEADRTMGKEILNHLKKTYAKSTTENKQVLEREAPRYTRYKYFRNE